MQYSVDETLQQRFPAFFCHIDKNSCTGPCINIPYNMQIYSGYACEVENPQSGYAAMATTARGVGKSRFLKQESWRRTPQATFPSFCKQIGTVLHLHPLTDNWDNSLFYFYNIYPNYQCKFHKIRAHKITRDSHLHHKLFWSKLCIIQVRFFVRPIFLLKWKYFHFKFCQ